jgi:hypothetical protein
MKRCEVCDRLYGPMEAEYVLYERLRSQKDIAQRMGNIQVLAESIAAMKDCEKRKEVLRRQRDEHVRDTHSMEEQMAWYGGAQ